MLFKIFTCLFRFLGICSEAFLVGKTCKFIIFCSSNFYSFLFLYGTDAFLLCYNNLENLVGARKTFLVQKVNT